LGFSRLKDFKPNYSSYSYFGGSSVAGVRLGVTAPYITSAEGKKRVKKNLKIARVSSRPSGDGKVTWEEYFSHPDTPGVIFTIYDWKGGMSCGFGISNVILGSMEAPYAEKLNQMLAQLVGFTLGG
jgi:hypothetical protein